MKNFVWFSLVLALGMCGCRAPRKAAAPPPPALEAISEENTPNMRGEGEKALKVLCAALRKEKTPVTGIPKVDTQLPKLAEQLLRLYGTFEKAEYLCCLQQGKFRDLLWKLTFRKQPGNTIRESLFFVRLCQEKGAVVIGGFGVKIF